MTPIINRVPVSVAVVYLCITGVLAGCFDKSSDQSSTALAPAKLNLSPLGVHLDGISAVLTVSGRSDPYTMSLDANNAASVSLPGVPDGQYTFTVTYYKNGLILARISEVDSIFAGATTAITFSPEAVDRNFDDDFDGWVNLAEVLWGSDPLVATSFPPGESAGFTVAVLGGKAESEKYTVYDTGGEAISSGASVSGNFTVTGGFTAYP